MMQLDESRARIGHRGAAISRAKEFALKALVILGGAVMVASAFVLSLVFLAVGLAVILVFGGYLWWKTRALRKQMRARTQGRPRADGEVIEGEWITKESRPAGAGQRSRLEPRSDRQ